MLRVPQLAPQKKQNAPRHRCSRNLPRRKSLYKALSPDGNPEFATILEVVRSLGLKLHTVAK